MGSTSITTDANGAKTSELRYTAWGEVRYNWGSTFTKYTYTGQYSNVPEFGLYYYNARWVDPQLGRFVQADIVVQGDNRKSNTTVTGVAETQYVPLTVQYSGEPAILNKLNADNAFLLSKGGLHNLSKEDRQKAKIAGVPLESQVLDRYAYSLNNPIKYNDPTGYDGCGGISGFSYCYFGNGNIVSLEWQGRRLVFNLTLLDSKNYEDRAILAAINDFVKAADIYKVAHEDLLVDIGHFTGSAIVLVGGGFLALGGFGTPITWGGVILTVGGGISFIADARAIKLTSERMLDACRTGNEKFMFLWQKSTRRNSK